MEKLSEQRYPCNYKGYAIVNCTEFIYDMSPVYLTLLCANDTENMHEE